MKIRLLACLASVVAMAQKHSDMITNSQGTDGFGSQFQDIIAAVIYAEMVLRYLAKRDYL